jgi:hypothetical protein
VNLPFGHRYTELQTMNTFLARVLYWALLTGLPLGSAQALMIQIVPSSPTITVGATFNLDLVISGLGNQASPSLSTFDIDVMFDSAILAIETTDSDGDSVIDSVTLDPSGQLDLSGLGVNFVFADLVSPGTLNLSELSFNSPADLDSLQAGQFTLASMTFQANTVGVSTVSLAVNSLGDALGDSLEPALQPLPTAVITVQNETTTIPEPSSGLLILAGLWTWYWRRKWAFGAKSRDQVLPFARRP